jgi:hypothetical protein
MLWQSLNGNATLYADRIASAYDGFALGHGVQEFGSELNRTFKRAMKITLSVSSVGAATLVLTCMLWVVGVIAFALGGGDWVRGVHASQILCISVFCAVATLWPTGRSAWGRVVGALVLVVLYGSYRVLSMGDGPWWIASSEQGIVTLAEPLSSWVQATLVRCWGREALFAWPVLMGGFTAWTWMYVMDRALGANRDWRCRLLAALIWGTSGISIGFFSYYVEHSQSGIPFVLFAFSAFRRNHIERGKTHSESSFYVGVALLAVAAACHLQYLAVLIAVSGSFWLRLCRRRGEVWWKGLAVSIGIAAGVIGTTYGVVFLGPYDVQAFSVGGGLDQRLMVHVWPKDAIAWNVHALLSLEHWLLVGKIVVLSAPLMLAAALATYAAGRRDRGEDYAVAWLPALAWMGFIALFGFDLGWPTDADLMLSMSVVPLWICAEAILTRDSSWMQKWSPSMIVLAIVCLANTWTITGALTRSVWGQLGQQNSARASLELKDGQPRQAVAPFRIVCRTGEHFRFEARGNPNCSYMVMRGIPCVAWGGHPYGGTADIEVRFQPEYIVSAGLFDAQGKADFDYVVEKLGQDLMPGLQMVVTEPGQSPETSAAFFFELQ